MSQFEKVLLQYPTAPWDWSLVSTNPSVSFQFILDHPDLPWIPKYVSRNVSISERDIRDNLEYPWDYEALCMNPNLSLDFFNEFIIKPSVVYHVEWHLLSSNPSITTLDIINNPKYEWNDRYLSANPNITSNFIINEGKDRQWFVPSICSNKGITDRDIFKSTLNTACNGTFEWDYNNLSSNPNLPIVFVNDNINKNWNFYAISTNASLNDIQKFHQIKWDGHGLSLNHNISIDYINSHPNVKWHRESLLMNLNLESILTNYSWFESVKSPETYMSSNDSITPRWIKRNSQYIDWKRLSKNQMEKK